jgi:hypothetical protein
VARRVERGGQPAAHEAGRAGDQDPHRHSLALVDGGREPSGAGSGAMSALDPSTPVET